MIFANSWEVTLISLNSIVVNGFTKKSPFLRPSLSTFFLINNVSTTEFTLKYLFLYHFFRLALTFDAVDNIGCINLTAFNDNVAKLFGNTIDALYAHTTYVRNVSIHFV